MKKLLSLGSLFVLGAIASLNSAKASNLALDNSSFYTTATWTDGSNQGIGFGAWNLTNSANAGRYIGGSGLNPLTSFGIFSSDPGSSSDALRPFTGGPLLAGQTFY